MRTKALEVISFISATVKARPRICLPVNALLELHAANGAAQVGNAFLDNFTVMFLDMGFQRLPPGTIICC